MQPVRRLFYMSLANSIVFIIGSSIAHAWMNPMSDYKDFISRAEVEYQAHQQEIREVEEYLEEKRRKNLKQIT